MCHNVTAVWFNAGRYFKCFLTKKNQDGPSSFTDTESQLPQYEGQGMRRNVVHKHKPVWINVGRYSNWMSQEGPSLLADTDSRRLQ